MGEGKADYSCPLGGESSGLALGMRASITSTCFSHTSRDMSASNDFANLSMALLRDTQRHLLSIVLVTQSNVVSKSLLNPCYSLHKSGITPNIRNACYHAGYQRPMPKIQPADIRRNIIRMVSCSSPDLCPVMASLEKSYPLLKPSNSRHKRRRSTPFVH